MGDLPLTAVDRIIRKASGLIVGRREAVEGAYKGSPKRLIEAGKRD